MKRSIFFFAAFMIIAASIQTELHAQDYYYWYQGSKFPLVKGNLQYILFDGDLLKESDKAYLTYSGNAELEEAPNLSWGIITQADVVFEDTEHIRYQIPSFRTEQGHKDFYVTHRFYVDLKDEKDISVLEDMADQYHVVIEGLFHTSLPTWYRLRWGVDSEYNALELANIFYESGLFKATEPEIIGALELLQPQANPQISTEPLQKSTKHIRKGQLLIERDGKTFNALGIEIK